MYPALWIAKTGLDAEQTRMSVISNNLANVNTTGFKRDRASFEDLIYQNVRQVGASSSQDTELPSGLNLGTGVRTVATQKLHTQGNLVQTNNNLDFAIEGNGFFQINHPTEASSTPATVPSAWTRRSDGDPERLSAGTGHHHSGQHPQRHRRLGRHRFGDWSRATTPDPDRQYRAGRFHQSDRAGGDGRQPVSRDQRPAVRRRSTPPEPMVWAR